MRQNCPVSMLASQIGYHPRNVKRVHLRSPHMNPSGDLFEPEFTVRGAATGAAVFRGEVTAWGPKWQSYWLGLDFTPLLREGEFYVKTGKLASSVFAVEEGISHKTGLDIVALDQLEHRMVRPGRRTRRYGEGIGSEAMPYLVRTAIVKGAPGRESSATGRIRSQRVARRDGA